MLGGAGRHVRVVVLDGDALAGREPLQGVLGGQVLGVEVVDDDFRLQGEEPREVGEPVREGAVGREVLEVAVVGRHVGAPAAREGERVLELGAHGEQRHRRRDRQRQGLGRVPAGAAHDGLAPGDHARDGIVVAGPDLPVVGEEPVREAAQPREGIRVVRGQRLVREVPGGEDERPAHGLEQQVVERRVGQEDAQAPVPGRDGRGQRGLAVPPRLEQDDRAGRTLEEPALQRADAAQRPGGGEVPDHDRERLGPAALAVAQAADRGVVGRVAGKVVAAEALDRDHGARPERRGPRPPARPRRRRSAPARRWAARRAAGRRWRRPRARRGTAGRPGRGTRHRRRRTGGTRASSSAPGRRGARSMIVARGPQFVQFVNG